MNDFELSQQPEVDASIDALRAGGVIAYPTEFCFGLGCDPRDEEALIRLLKIKRRDMSQGVILIAANVAQIESYADLGSLPNKREILASWPGRNTWLLPARSTVPSWITGQHDSVAMRVPDHPLCRQLCEAFGHPLVSTSANRHAEAAHTDVRELRSDLGDQIDVIIDAPLGGAGAASTIRDAISGEVLR